MIRLCIALAVAWGQPVDLRPDWREDRAPIHDLARPRPADAREELRNRTGQIVLRDCRPRAQAVLDINLQGYRRRSADLTHDGLVIERWGREVEDGGGWAMTIYDPAQGLICPFTFGPRWTNEDD